MRTWLAVLTCCAACCAHAADVYPNKPIRIIITVAPGGGADITARAVGQKLSEAWGQQVVVDNRPGGNGIVGMDIALIHISEPTRLLSISYAVFCLKKKKKE